MDSDPGLDLGLDLGLLDLGCDPSRDLDLGLDRDPSLDVDLDLGRDPNLAATCSASHPCSAPRTAVPSPVNTQPHTQHTATHRLPRMSPKQGMTTPALGDLQ